MKKMKNKNKSGVSEEILMKFYKVLIIDISFLFAKFHKPGLFR